MDDYERFEKKLWALDVEEPEAHPQTLAEYVQSRYSVAGPEESVPPIEEFFPNLDVDDYSSRGTGYGGLLALHADDYKRWQEGNLTPDISNREAAYWIKVPSADVTTLHLIGNEDIPDDEWMGDEPDEREEKAKCQELYPNLDEIYIVGHIFYASLSRWKHRHTGRESRMAVINDILARFSNS